MSLHLALSLGVSLHWVILLLVSSLLVVLLRAWYHLGEASLLMKAWYCGEASLLRVVLLLESLGAVLLAALLLRAVCKNVISQRLHVVGRAWSISS